MYLNTNPACIYFVILKKVIHYFSIICRFNLLCYVFCQMLLCVKKMIKSPVHINVITPFAISNRFKIESIFREANLYFNYAQKSTTIIIKFEIKVIYYKCYSLCVRSSRGFANSTYIKPSQFKIKSC